MRAKLRSMAFGYVASGILDRALCSVAMTDPILRLRSLRQA